MLEQLLADFRRDVAEAFGVPITLFTDKSTGENNESENRKSRRPDQG